MLQLNYTTTFNLEDEYEKVLGYKHIPGGRWTNLGYASDPEVAKFLWSRGNIDDLNREVQSDEGNYFITPIKYAICFILFDRATYEEMGGFNVVPETRSAGLNGDEGQIMEYCMHHCKCTVVATNTICGHFSYPQQEKNLFEYRETNRYFFDIKDE